MQVQQPRSVRHRLALAGAALALTAAAIGVFTPLRDFYREIVFSTTIADQVENRIDVATRMISQRRLDDAQNFLQQAMELDQRNLSLHVEKFAVSSWLEFREAFDFDESYNPGKRNLLLPLIVEGYRLAHLTDDVVQRSRILSHIGLMQYFDPSPNTPANIEALLRQAIDLDASNALAWMCLGFLLEREGRREEAVAAWLTAIQHDPDEGLVWSALGEHYRETGEHDVALDAYVRAYHSGRPALGNQWAFRKRGTAKNEVTKLLLKDLLALTTGRRTLSLTDNERQQISEDLLLDDWHLRARVHVLAKRYAKAAALAWAVLESKQTRYWRRNEFTAIALLFELAPELPAASRRGEALASAWAEISAANDISAVTLSADFGPLWVISSLNQVARIEPQSRLFKAGVLPGDKIIGVAGRPVGSPMHLSPLLNEASTTDFPIMVQRASKPVVLMVPYEEAK